MNVYSMVVFFTLSMNLIFEECVAANYCSINDDKREGLFISKTIRNS